MAANSTFEIIFLETDSLKLRGDVIHEPEKYSQHRIGVFNISLLLHWKLELIQRTLDHREGGFIVNSSSRLICKATDGFPFSRVKFIGTEKLSKKFLEESETTNETLLTFQSKIDDHFKKVGCQAGNDVIYDRIKIFHHPTKLEFVPPANGFVQNGTSILCKAVDGYPTPEVRWAWVSGHEYSEHFFSLNNESNVLYIRKNAPIGSKWMFECISKNSIPGSLNRGTVETISFTIGDPPIPYVLIISILLGIAFLIILVVITIYCCRSHSFYCKKKKIQISKSSSKCVSTNSMEEYQDSMNKTLIQHKTSYPVDEV